MMITKGFLPISNRCYNEALDPAWVAGAKAGMTKLMNRMQLRRWREFHDRLEHMFHFMAEVRPAEPGTSPDDGSLYDSLGGYVSVAGRMTDEGLSFSVPSRRQQIITALFPGMEMYRTGREVLIPHSELESFNRLVPLRGPLMEGRT